LTAPPSHGEVVRTGDRRVPGLSGGLRRRHALGRGSFPAAGDKVVWAALSVKAA
jgi:hypothetical protein